MFICLYASNKNTQFIPSAVPESKSNSKFFLTAAISIFRFVIKQKPKTNRHPKTPLESDIISDSNGMYLTNIPILPNINEVIIRYSLGFLRLVFIITSRQTNITHNAKDENNAINAIPYA
jgi:hypothetical protein